MMRGVYLYLARWVFLVCAAFVMIACATPTFQIPLPEEAGGGVFLISDRPAFVAFIQDRHEPPADIPRLDIARSSRGEKLLAAIFEGEDYGIVLTAEHGKLAREVLDREKLARLRELWDSWQCVSRNPSCRAVALLKFLDRGEDLTRLESYEYGSGWEFSGSDEFLYRCEGDQIIFKEAETGQQTRFTIGEFIYILEIFEYDTGFMVQIRRPDMSMCVFDLNRVTGLATEIIVPKIHNSFSLSECSGNGRFLMLARGQDPPFRGKQYLFDRSTGVLKGIGFITRVVVFHSEPIEDVEVRTLEWSK